MSRPAYAPSPPRDSNLARAVVFVLLGYVYIALVVGAMLALILLGRRHDVGTLLMFPTGLLFSILLALWLSTPEPPGVRLSRAQAPVFFRAIDRARARLRAPEADVVILTTELNASVLERPRMGMPWWPRRYLSIGLPLLHALSTDEVEAILAHEFAHLSRDHGRVRRWLVRAVNAWMQLSVGLRASRRWGAVFFIPFTRGYVPRLERLTQAVSRAHEFESDWLAARVAGREIAGRALLRLETAGHRLEQDIWPSILRDSWTEANPPADAFERVLAAVEQPPEADAARAAIGAVLREATLENDSHPSLAERLEHLGQPVSHAVLPAVEMPAVETFLPALPSDIIGSLSEQWHEHVTPLWQAAHADASASRDTDVMGDACRAARWARARWAVQCEPPSAVISLLRGVLAETPDHGEAAVALAILLVAGEDADGREEGVRLLEQVAERDSLPALKAVEVLEQQYARLGRGDDRRRTLRRKDALRETVVRGLHERETLEVGDTLRPYRIAPATQASLVRALERHPEIREAFLVQKRGRHLEESPL